MNTTLIQKCVFFSEANNFGQIKKYGLKNIFLLKRTYLIESFPKLLKKLQREKKNEIPFQIYFHLMWFSWDIKNVKVLENKGEYF